MATPPRTRVLDLGDGLVLRALLPGDAEAIAEACGDPAIVRWTRVPVPYTLEDAREFIEAATPADGEAAHTFAVTLEDPDHARGRLVGACGLEVDARTATAELGYWTAPDARGRRVTTRAAAAVVRHGFDTLDLARIWMVAAVDNPASNAIAERLGFRFEGVQRAAAAYREPDGRPAGRGDMRMYGLLPSDMVAP